MFKFKVSAQSLIRGVLEFVIRNCVVTDVSFPGVHCEEHFVFEVVSFEITKGNSERVAFETSESLKHGGHSGEALCLI